MDWISITALTLGIGGLALLGWGLVDAIRRLAEHIVADPLTDFEKAMKRYGYVQRRRNEEDL